MNILSTCMYYCPEVHSKLLLWTSLNVSSNRGYHTHEAICATICIHQGRLKQFGIFTSGRGVWYSIELRGYNTKIKPPTRKSCSHVYLWLPQITTHWIVVWGDCVGAGLSRDREFGSQWPNIICQLHNGHPRLTGLDPR